MRQRTGITQSTLSRAECGINTSSLGHELGTLLGLYGADRCTRQRLVDLAARAHVPGWCATREAGRSADHWDPLLRAETGAISIQCWHPAMVPALAQAPAYARWVLAATGTDHLDSQVAARTHRQHCVLHGDQAAQVTVFITPAGLHIPDPDLRHEQYRHLLQLARQDHLTVRITKAAPAEIGNFEIITGRDPWVHIDHPTLDLAVEGHDQLRRHHALWHTLTEHALSAEDSFRVFARAAPAFTKTAGANR